MTAPLVDSRQRERFLEDVGQLGYKREEFGFVHSSKANADSTLTHHVHIVRGNIRREYLHGGEIRWLGDALRDLYAGHFGPPTDGDTWNRPVLITDGILKGKWMADAFLKLENGDRIEFTAPDRIYDTEAEAFNAGRKWLRNQIVANS